MTGNDKTEFLSAVLITQGSQKFYTLTMPIDVIAHCCSPNPRDQDPELGFQRTLDESRALSISNYVRNGGVIPSSIILSAQESAGLQYVSRNKTLGFTVSPSSFLIIDGQHRVFGFRKLVESGFVEKLRIPVVIFPELSPVQEARIFIDVNTLQQPVPRELLLDIKKLAETENMEEILLDQLFTYFEEENDSYLSDKLSRYEKKKNKISKVTFYDSIKPLLRTFEVNNTNKLYTMLNSYFSAVRDIIGSDKSEIIITKPIVFKILCSHAKAIIGLIMENDPDAVGRISEYKKYLIRSLAKSDFYSRTITSYLKEVDKLDKMLLTSTRIKI
ncbi:DGQHR domain-containing protein [Asaia prunellae]|uniref:DGQHR domain-containing protein n=1 Tax=Asaia prunellae TaxID=610245 RepID=UPI00046F22C7|nr:DGQHR domain-containing protein [Asaia prunellae]